MSRGEDGQPDGAERGPERSDDEVWAELVEAFAAPAADPQRRFASDPAEGSTLDDPDASTDATNVTDPDSPGSSASAGSTDDSSGSADAVTGRGTAAGTDDDPDGAGERGSVAPAGPVDTSGQAGPATGFEDIAEQVAAERAETERVAQSADAAEDDPLDPTEHYVPPPPPPLPQGDKVTRAAWAGVIGGPLYLILATVFGWDLGSLAGPAAVLAFVAGFITLVSRMRDDRDDDGDDGAVV